jgi:hypothetical protein
MISGGEVSHRTSIITPPVKTAKQERWTNKTKETESMPQRTEDNQGHIPLQLINLRQVTTPPGPTQADNQTKAEH